MTTTYRVQLDDYFGPLDLLLYLVRKHEVDVVSLPIASITKQFLEYLTVLEFINLDVVGDFVVMASTLVEMKSRQVLIRREEEETEEVETPLEEETSSGLIQQLLEYKQFKDASKALEEQAFLWQNQFPRLSNDRPTEGKNPAADTIKEVELWDLVSALSRVLRQTVVATESRIQYDETPIGIYVERIGLRAREEGRVAFSSCFEQTNDRGRIVGTFLAILELLRHHQYRAEQPVDFSEIWVLPPLDPNAPLPKARETQRREQAELDAEKTE
ncbi:Segregation and condensation protein A [hydrothermal vent metagenome]|uniref:Segregation and condensation protein A n=1 Tax=hydrothermal vent metagenome TaxID=652676 RepID=A0A3B1DJV8_9ZZZZ